MWRYATTAPTAGRRCTSSHSARKSTPLTPKYAGTSVPGETRRAALAWIATSTIDEIEVAMSIAGSAVTSTALRNRASRVALPPTNCAVTAAAQSIAVSIEREVELDRVIASRVHGSRQNPTFNAEPAEIAEKS